MSEDAKQDQVGGGVVCSALESENDRQYPKEYKTLTIGWKDRNPLPSSDSVQQTIGDPEDNELGQNGRGGERLALKKEDDKQDKIKDKTLPEGWKKDNPCLPPKDGRQVSLWDWNRYIGVKLHTDFKVWVCTQETKDYTLPEGRKAKNELKQMRITDTHWHWKISGPAKAEEHPTKAKDKKS